MIRKNGSATTKNYNPAFSMGTRPHPPESCYFGGGPIDGDHMAASADAMLIAAGIMLSAVVGGVVLFGLLVKWLWESIK